MDIGTLSPDSFTLIITNWPALALATSLGTSTLIFQFSGPIWILSSTLGIIPPLLDNMASIISIYRPKINSKIVFFAVAKCSSAVKTYSGVGINQYLLLDVSVFSASLCCTEKPSNVCMKNHSEQTNSGPISPL
jgi:hypothetical protein